MIRFTDTKSLTMSKKTQAKIGGALGFVVGLGAVVVKKILDPSKEELMKRTLKTIEKMKKDGEYKVAVHWENELKARLDLMDKIKKERLEEKKLKALYLSLTPQQRRDHEIFGRIDTASNPYGSKTYKTPTREEFARDKELREKKLQDLRDKELTVKEQEVLRKHFYGR